MQTRRSKNPSHWLVFGQLLSLATMYILSQSLHRPLTDLKEICSAFNSHSAASGHLFDNIMSELNHNLKPQAELQGYTSQPSVSMSSFSLGEVTDVPLTAECITHVFKLNGIIHTAWKTAYILVLYNFAFTFFNLALIISFCVCVLLWGFLLFFSLSIHFCNSVSQ